MALKDLFIKSNNEVQPKETPAPSKKKRYSNKQSIVWIVLFNINDFIHWYS